MMDADELLPYLLFFPTMMSSASILIPNETGDSSEDYYHEARNTFGSIFREAIVGDDDSTWYPNGEEDNTTHQSSVLSPTITEGQRPSTTTDTADVPVISDTEDNDDSESFMSCEELSASSSSSCKCRQASVRLNAIL